ncbi:CoA pyrophosphatase [Sinanaerobacter sp. ZZT-01]|uniref:NUDIX hydrolase n=1 Tax=Sinanaerobacter sp. ZZT-01 TaxID=3111540 RepID=UPI002D776A35|nr:CoA pyrophosphatase [Sinanaerobacter sp. ZZT-01]WRR92556.1 CoA pyrophosphatase [Sinanaerobacter sp. ZZT-01]
MNISDIKETLGNRSPRIMEIKKENAVFLPIIEWNGELSLLFEVRSDTLKHQPGEVCFPGGRREEGETLKECACRETAEELGIHEEDIEIYGQFDTLHNYTNVTIHTFIGTISKKAINLLNFDNSGKADYISNLGEVKELFLVPISFFQNKKPYVYPFAVKPQIKEDFPYYMLNSPEKYKWLEGEYTVPIFHYKKYVIWGMTARILCHFMEEFKIG